MSQNNRYATTARIELEGIDYFRIRDGVPYFLEINPLPGLNPESSDLLYLAYRMGLTYPQLIGMILDAAATRCGLV